MMEKKYTQKELEAAKELLRQRLESEQSMSLDVERLLEEYAEYIIHALFNGASDEDIELLIEDLIDRIMDDCRTLAVDEHDVDDDILAFVFDGGDETVEERVRNRAETFLDELTAAYSAAVILDMDEQELIASVRGSMDDPWDNEAIGEVRAMIERGEVDEDISDFEERHYGKGSPVSSKVAIGFITASAIVDTWNEWGWRTASEGGAIGYYVERGSSFPCEECDSHTGQFFDITDKSHIPQYHRSCRCFVVYVYDKNDITDILK